MKTLRALFIVAALWVAWLTRELHYVQLPEEALDSTLGKQFRHFWPARRGPFSSGAHRRSGMARKRERRTWEETKP